MNAPWFDPNLYAWIPGTVLGVTAGLWGTSVGLLARCGRARSLVLGTAWLLVACALLPERWRRAGVAIQVVLALVVQHLLSTGW